MDRKYRILIVDDEAPLRAGLQTYLELEGYEADTAASAEEALTLDLRSYDLILLDIMMGDMSGIEMAAKLKADKATADLPIIFLTARDTRRRYGVGTQSWRRRLYSQTLLDQECAGSDRRRIAPIRPS